jgi:hypothetical protein
MNTIAKSPNIVMNTVAKSPKTYEKDVKLLKQIDKNSDAKKLLMFSSVVLFSPEVGGVVQSSDIVLNDCKQASVNRVKPVEISSNKDAKIPPKTLKTQMADTMPQQSPDLHGTKAPIKSLKFTRGDQIKENGSPVNLKHRSHNLNQNSGVT